MDRGLVLNIQRYCLHDGPGIRTTVFLKGCPLSCPWCHNPESQLPSPELQYVEARCVRCGACIAACPEGTADMTSPACHACGVCVDACPADARRLAGQELTVNEVVREVLKDQPFHDESGGGVTLSGGEPLGQPRFVVNLLEALRRQGVHTAVDTSGYAPEPVVSAVAPLVDLFLYDVKCVDDAVHRRETGVSNELILNNLRLLARLKTTIWVRVPLVPGFNADDEQLLAIAELLVTLPAVSQVNVLPYHALGTHKVRPELEMIRRAGPRQGGGELSPQRIARAVELFQSMGLRTLVGG